MIEIRCYQCPITDLCSARGHSLGGHPENNNCPLLWVLTTTHSLKEPSEDSSRSYKKLWEASK